MDEKERLALVEDTWEKLGHKIRGHHKWVWVRTLPFNTMTPSGLLHLPPKLATFHGEVQAHKVIVRAVVVASGTCGVAEEFKPGDMVEFQRLQFAYHRKLDRFTQEYVGWVDANHILFTVHDDEEAAA